jgi:catechol 2,3-dioxygenase-like lactoylglutathione lyase family enzyme
MRVYRISAVTLKVKEMEKSCKFFLRIPGFRMVYGSGAPSDTFATFEVGGDKGAYLNLELMIDDGGGDAINLALGQNSDYRNISQGHDRSEPSTLGKARAPEGGGREDFGRIIFHTENVDELYSYMKKDEFISRYTVFETKPADAPWGERFFHIREPSGYQLSFAQPLRRQ